MSNLLVDDLGGIYFANPSVGDIRALFDFDLIWTDIAVTRDGRVFANTFDDLYEIDMTNGTAAQVASLTYGANGLVIDAQDRIYVSYNTQTQIDVFSGETFEIVDTIPATFSAGDMIIDGGLLYLSTLLGGLMTIDLESEEILSNVSHGIGALYGMQFQDNTLYALASDDIYELDPATGASVRLGEWPLDLRVNGAASTLDVLLDGTTGNDTIEAPDFSVNIAGGAGNDRLLGGAGNDSIAGGTQFDTITAGEGNDTVDGGLGRDLVFLNQGDDIYFDNAQGGDLGRDTVFGGFGNDTIQGGNGDDVFRGEDGNDVINGRLGNDLIFGGGQFDTITAGEGNDTVDGGRGRDLVFLNQGNDVYFDNAQGGDLGRDTVWAGFGEDTIEGGNGDDVFYGQDGADVINARLGDDTVYGGDQFDTISAGEGADRVWGGNGRDLIFLNQGDDIYFDNTQGGELGRDTVFGGFGNDTIQGGNGDDVFRGENGNDVIFGRLGDDLIFGGAGADTIDGGVGSDTLTGGTGADRFIFAGAELSSGQDVITDFDRAVDRIEITGLTAGDVQVVVNTPSEATVSLDGVLVLTVQGDGDLSGFGTEDIFFT